MIDLFEIQKYDTKNSCFGLKGGKYLDLVRVICTDFQSIREMDLEYENLKMSEKRKQVLNELRKKLNTLQPPEKKVSQYRLYHCQWKVGDMYAYQLEGEYAKERGLNGKYLLFY